MARDLTRCPVLSSLIKNLLPLRNRAAQGILGADHLIQQFEFESRGLANEVDRPLGILDAGQLHQNPALALDLNGRLGHPELIHPVADGFQRLLHGVVLQMF